MNGLPCTIMRFKPNDLLRIGGVDHVYVRATEAGHVMHRHGSSLESTLTHAEMARVTTVADFVHGRGFYSEPDAFVRERSGVGRLADLPARELPDVMWRHHWVEAFLEAEARGGTKRSDASMAAFIEREQEKAYKLPFAAPGSGARGRKKRAGSKTLTRDVPVARTLRTWVAIYEKGGCRAHALRSRHRFCGNREPRLEPAVYGLLKEAAAGYASGKRPTIVRIREDLEIKLRRLNATRVKADLPSIPLPSIKKVRKAVKALPAFATYAGRRGTAAARRRFLLVKDAIVTTRPGERVEMDEWLVHLHKLVVEAGLWLKLSDPERRAFARRFQANIAIDVATRCIVGLSIGETATSALALAALRMIVIDKSSIAAAAGCATPWDMAFSPEMVFTDGGSALISDETRAAIEDMSSGQDVPPAGEPERRPFIERFNETLDLSFLPYFTGRTFSNVEDKGDCDPQLQASLALEAFCKALVKWIVDVYHNTPHEGLGGETPRAAWSRLSDLFGVIPPPALDARRAIFGVELERKVTLRGVRVAGLHYSDAELGQAILRRGLETATIRVDPYDLGAVSLRVGSAWRRLPCRTEGLEGVAWDIWTRAARDLRARFRRQADMTRDVVLDAIEAIKGIASNAEAAIGIDRLAPSADEIERVERGLLAGFEVPDGSSTGGRDPDETGASRDPFDRAIEAGGGMPPPDEPPASASASDPSPRRRSPRVATTVEPAPPAGTSFEPNDTSNNPKDTWIED